MKYQIAICDDDRFYIDKLVQDIQTLAEKNHVECEIRTYCSGEQLLKATKVTFDIIFLDIDMGGKNGIEVAAQIRKITKKPIIIFITSFISYCPKGYEVDALRYILKDNRVFEQALEEAFRASINEIARCNKERVFPFRDGRRLIKYGQIVYVESRVHEVVFFIIENEKIVTYQMREKLDEIEQLLDGYNFCRIHKSYLVNMDYVESCKRFEVKLKTGSILNVARSRYHEVLTYR